ncbi:MAG: glycosyltransferase [Gracilimonas sp.]
MTRTKLNIISHSFPHSSHPYDATFVKDHAKALSKDLEVQVTVPTPYAIPFTSRYRKNRSDLLSFKDIKARRIQYFSFPKRQFPKLIKNSLSDNLIHHLKKTSPDLIHVHFLYPSGLAVPDLKNVLSCPIVLTIHGADFYHSITSSSLRKLMKQSLEAADFIIAVGPQLHKDILNKFPQLQDKLKTIHNYVDTSYFRPVEKEEKKHHRKKLNIDRSSFQLLCVANFRHKKGIDVLVEALSLLDNKAEIELHLIGRLNEEPAFQKQVESKITAQKLDNIHIHGPKSRDEILRWMQAADGFVLPSRKESFGIALIEAMACGLPVISTKSGGPEVIISDEYGKLIDTDNAQEMAVAIEEMAQDMSVNTESQNQYIGKHFGEKKYAEEHKKLYQKLLQV